MELVYIKIILTLQKYLLCGSSEWQQIKQCSRLDQKSVNKFLVAEKSKVCEIYRIMCEVYIYLYK